IAVRRGRKQVCAREGDADNAVANDCHVFDDLIGARGVDPDVELLNAPAFNRVAGQSVQDPDPGPKTAARASDRMPIQIERDVARADHDPVAGQSMRSESSVVSWVITSPHWTWSASA